MSITETMYIRKCFLFCSSFDISMLDMKSHQIPQAWLDYVYLFGKGAFETLQTRRKGTSDVNKTLILYSQKSDFYNMALPC